MKKHLMTAAAVVLAVGAAFAGSRFAPAEGFWRNSDGTGTFIPTASIAAHCPNNSSVQCAYYFDGVHTTYQSIRLGNYVP